MSRRNVVALGGGHGLAASLQALRRVTDSLTAIVGVADDGGSSGRLRSEFGILPPGDLRMALAALCGDDSWGRTWEEVIQHRFGGEGELAGHSVGNLLITALWEHTGDAVTGLDWVAALLGANGRVLPCTEVPLTIVAEVLGHDPRRPDEVTEVRGQVEVATTAGDVLHIALDPPAPEACHEAIVAVEEADALVLGPGSWYTSVIPHLVIPDLARAIADSPAQRVVVLNLNPQVGETSGFAAHTHLDVLYNYLPDLRVDTVIADARHVEDLTALKRSCADLGAELFLMDVSRADAAGIHDPQRLAVAFDTVLA
ncbi:MAG: uridine diphosphate-N-acetylglucosamine-binding protein YvcK [Actinomycetales bacterium]|nr:uridine diphosphate-N-acetylglucosamine-binding protein YvcK [Actinomycetales bacterium]